MGSKLAGSSLSDALFPPVQQRVLSLLFGQPERRFQSAQLIRLVGAGTGAVHRFLKRLAECGLVTVTPVGNQRHYQANRGSPVFEELRGLVMKTFGLVGPLNEALAPLADRIDAAFVYGSVARGEDTARSDIDVMIVSDSVDYHEVFERLQAVEPNIGRSVNPTLKTLADWKEGKRRRDSFIYRVAESSKMFVIDSDRNL